MEYKRSEAAMLAINRFIVTFDFREAKISSEFPASEAIKRTLYTEAYVVITAIGIHVPFCSASRENSELLLANVIIKTGTRCNLGKGTK